MEGARPGGRRASAVMDPAAGRFWPSKRTTTTVLGGATIALLGLVAALGAPVGTTTLSKLWSPACW